MSRYNPYYYLLFVLLIFGAFASMAQNDYGIKILGGAALAFGLLFLLQLVTELRSKRKPDAVAVAELTGLTILSVILSMRVFYLRFPFVELLFGIAGLLVIASYLLRIIRAWNTLHQKSTALALLVLLFLGSVTCYFISMSLVPFMPLVAEPFGAAGFFLLLVFIIGAIVKKQMLVEGERLSAFAYIARVRDRSIVLASLFVLFTAYMGLTKIGFIPKMYSDEFPQKYFELVNKAEAGEEKPVDGKFRHEEFKQQYDLFVSRHIQSQSK
jgi:hypothetical protein